MPGERRGAGPRFRVWPPVAAGVPWLAGWWVGRRLGARAVGTGRWVLAAGRALLLAFALWNGWCLWYFARYRTGLMPGQDTNVLLTSGPYRVSRNPLYVGLVAGYIGAALMARSAGALALTPVAWAGLHWGAVLPEEAYLRGRLGKPYQDYRRRVQRWL